MIGVAGSLATAKVCDEALAHFLGVESFTVDAADMSDAAMTNPTFFQAGMLVDAALNDLEPQKLVLFIQSFGIPVASMSKLLKKLDMIVQVRFFAKQLGWGCSIFFCCTGF